MTSCLPALSAFAIMLMSQGHRAFGTLGASALASTAFHHGFYGAEVQRCKRIARANTLVLSPSQSKTRRQVSTSSSTSTSTSTSTGLGYSEDAFDGSILVAEGMHSAKSSDGCDGSPVSTGTIEQTAFGDLNDELSKVWSSIAQPTKRTKYTGEINERISQKRTSSKNEWSYRHNESQATNHDADTWSNSNERRRQRINSLTSFNKASITQKQKQQHKQYKQTSSPLLPPLLKLNLPYNDPSQLQAIQSNAPAVLLSSGPGTGKSHVLSLRIAYLLRRQLDYETSTNQSNCNANEPSIPVTLVDNGVSATPDSLVILSFTNRDAERLKSRALDYLFPDTSSAATRSDDGNNRRRSVSEAASQWRETTRKQIWSGTMHVFSLAVLRKYGCKGSGSNVPYLRVLPARAMRNRVSMSLRSLLNPVVGVNNGENESRGNDKIGEEEEALLRQLRTRHLRALHDVGQSRSILFQNIVRCIDLWKEALLIPHYWEREQEQQLCEEKEGQLRNDCVELAMRLGVPESSALLALDVFPTYQARHAAAGTVDPSDLAGMAYRLLLSNPEALHLLRAKLKHIIVDEYQDMSVSQHALLRLVVRGESDDDCDSPADVIGDADDKTQQKAHRKSPILVDPHSRIRNASLRKRSRLRASLKQNFNVPNLFVAGDTHQSIYGWRAAAPSLTVEGFRRDYPQGVVAAFRTCYRLPSDILEASNMLLPPIDNDGILQTTCSVSPAAANKVASSLGNDSPLKKDIRLGESLLLSKGLQKLDSSVLIHGLWDSREEYKYIASTIRRRSKERRKALISAIKNLDLDVELGADDQLLDLTDVAVMVRSFHQMDLLKEALRSYGIPFTVAGDNDNDQSNIEDERQCRGRYKPAATIKMKPATLMTMHRSKGEEFDDVYLSGWSEGSFPHPDAVSSNLVHEERRLAYVAITRARQRVVITHSLMSRVLYYGKDGSKRYVTGQVQPSRFLYELVPSKKKADGILDNNDEDESSYGSSILDDNLGTVWDRRAGIKDYVSGHNVPEFFRKSYHAPTGFVDKKADLRRHTSIDMNRLPKTPETQHMNEPAIAQSSLGRVMVGDKVIVIKKKHKQYGKIGIVDKVTNCFVFFTEYNTRARIKIKPLFLQMAPERQNKNITLIEVSEGSVHAAKP